MTVPEIQVFIATDKEVRTLTDDKTYIQTDFQPSPQSPAILLIRERSHPRHNKILATKRSPTF
ncbi:hypothetical protein [Nostoc sp.]|uniref:hypothetical protein n=1 Tax=Nostoc sp. TaxID=1180 RepID=UPI002FF55EAA